MVALVSVTVTVANLQIGGNDDKCPGDYDCCDYEHVDDVASSDDRHAHTDTYHSQEAISAVTIREGSSEPLLPYVNGMYREAYVTT